MKTFWRRLEDVLARCLEDVFKTFLQDVLKTSWRCLKNVLKKSWRRIAKTNLLVLKTSSEDVRLRRTYFWRRRRKTSSIRLHQDECLPGYFTEHLSLATFVPWILQSQSIIYSIYSVEVVRESNLCWLSGKVISIKAWYWWENFTNNFSCRTEQIVRGTDVIIFDT